MNTDQTESLPVALAELCGWKQHGKWWVPPIDWINTWRDEETGLAKLDDNFLRQAREKLLVTDAQRSEFVVELIRTFTGIGKTIPVGLVSFYVLNSTPSQQATVLVKMFSTKTPITGE